MKRTKFLLIFLILLFNCDHYAADVHTIKVESRKMHRKIPVIVITPAANSAQKKFPVVYLLHGYGGDYQDWSHNADLKRLADRYQLILICPDGSENSWYFDSPLDTSSQYETFIASELVEWIDNHYPTIAEKQGRAITGFSMGGHGSLYLALRNPQNYIAAGSMSGGVDLTYSTKSWDISDKLGVYKNFPERWHANSIINLVDHFERREQQLALLIDCGVDDFFIEINRNLHEKLLQLNFPHDYYERPGGHSWDYWVRVLEYHLLFFNEAFSNYSF